MTDTVLHVNNVCVMRQGRGLITDVSWSTEPGQHWAILGPNGSGKTTLLQVILGYLWPTRGTVDVLGHRLGAYDVRELRKTIGFVSANMDARLEQTETALAIVGTGKYASYSLYAPLSQADQQKATELLNSLGLERLAAQPYGSLSQGERQKVLIARALMSEPQVLVLDEPCTGLDFPSRERLLALIDDLAMRADSPQILYVTHYPNEIVRAISHVLLLKDGRVIAAAEKSTALTESNLSEAYSAPVRLWIDDDGVISVRLRRDQEGSH